MITWRIMTFSCWKTTKELCWGALIQYDSKCSKILNTSCLSKKRRQTGQTRLLKKQSDQGLPHLLFRQAFCELQPWKSLFSWELKKKRVRNLQKILTLNAPIITKVVCLPLWLKCLRSLYGKQCGPRPDCSYRSSLFWVHVVCFYT